MKILKELVASMWGCIFEASWLEDAGWRLDRVPAADIFALQYETVALGRDSGPDSKD